jgi:hypothetical protein
LIKCALLYWHHIKHDWSRTYFPPGVHDFNKVSVYIYLKKHTILSGGRKPHPLVWLYIALEIKQIACNCLETGNGMVFVVFLLNLVVTIEYIWDRSVYVACLLLSMEDFRLGMFVLWCIHWKISDLECLYFDAYIKRFQIWNVCTLKLTLEDFRLGMFVLWCLHWKISDLECLYFDRWWRNTEIRVHQWFSLHQ